MNTTGLFNRFIEFEGKKYKTMAEVASIVLNRKTGGRYQIHHIGQSRWIAVRASLSGSDVVLLALNREDALAGNFSETPLKWSAGGGSWKKLSRVTRDWIDGIYKIN
jgi:hypothetical protein